MKTTYNLEFAELERKIRKNQTLSICYIIHAKADQYRKILENGQEIYNQALGERFVRMYNLRKHLLSKIFLLDDLVSDIHKKNE